MGILTEATTAHAAFVSPAHATYIEYHKMSCSLFLMMVGVALVTAAPQYNTFGNGLVNPGLVNPGFLGGVHPNPGFANPGLVNPGYGLQQPIQLNQAGQPCEKFSRNQFGNYVCTETLEQIAPGALNPSGSQFGRAGGSGR